MCAMASTRWQGLDLRAGLGRVDYWTLKIRLLMFSIAVLLTQKSLSIALFVFVIPLGTRIVTIST
jgi:hypothetical protein